MDLLILVLTLAAKVSTLPISPEQVIAIARAQPALEYTLNQDEFGQYDFSYLTGEGTIRKEHGKLVPSPDGKSKVLAVSGEVIFIGDDHKVYVTKYSAGVDGTKIEGSHLPVAPDSEASVMEDNTQYSDSQIKSEEASEVLPVGKIPDLSKSVIQMILPKEFIQGVVRETSKTGSSNNAVNLPSAILPLSGDLTMTSQIGPVHISQIRIPEELMSEVTVPDMPRVLAGVWQKISI